LNKVRRKQGTHADKTLRMSAFGNFPPIIESAGEPGKGQKSGLPQVVKIFRYDPPTAAKPAIAAQKIPS
jgi:hypothetical protein